MDPDNTRPNKDDCIGFISKIQRYSTKDGPGIRTTVFLMGCNLNCKWCSNPELINKTRRLMCFDNRCERCGACAKVCEKDAIRISEKSAIVDRERCDVCGNCVDICPNDVYETVGYYITVKKLCDSLLRDKEFYDNSGGGITFSGGEPALQADFVMKTAKILKINNVHIALDTAGLVAWETMEKILNYVDLVLFDIKAYDGEIHRKCTIVDNKMILENARKIAEKKKEMIIRMPVVPGWNDTISDIKNTFQFVKSLGSSVKQVDILNYHNLAEGKYHHLGLDYPLKDVKPCRDEKIDSIVLMANSMGLKTTIGG